MSPADFVRQLAATTAASPEEFLSQLREAEEVMQRLVVMWAYLNGNTNLDTGSVVSLLNALDGKARE